MTQLIDRPRLESDSPLPGKVASHPQFTLGTMVILGVLGTVAAVVLAIIALTVTASRYSVYV
ncbi:MAG: hypothetical protein Q8Q52_05650, partial [Acidimicrobiia bacterium]|nr:hypothetical protein [Acidimicrobiia bacterium]